MTFFPAVVRVAYYAGQRPAVLTAVMSGLSAWWFWIEPTGFDFGLATLVALGFYAFVVAVDIFFIVGMDGARRRLAAEVERSTALAESRDLLLKEVQHRVSNNIQVVSALLAIEARGAPDEVSRRAILQASTRTALIAKLQRRSPVSGSETPRLRSWRGRWWPAAPFVRRSVKVLFQSLRCDAEMRIPEICRRVAARLAKRRGRPITARRPRISISAAPDWVEPKTWT